MISVWSLPLLAAGGVWQAIATYQENKQPPPGKLVRVGGRQMHVYYLSGKAASAEALPTVVIEHSLGGVEGYLLIEQISEFANVCLCDRAGYGYSEMVAYPATSSDRADALDTALTAADIQPPYILVGNSLGSYHSRLYAHRFPQKVAGLVLTDGLHEQNLLRMPWQLRLLQLLFFSGFCMSTFGATFGIVRLFGKIGLFELIKPELRKFSEEQRSPVLRSFYRPQHWLTMAREISNLDRCGKQLQQANASLGNLPVINIKAQAFFKPTPLARWLPLKAADRLRGIMHSELMELSERCKQVSANNSSHFVWVDQPQVIVEAIQHILFDFKQPN